VLDVLELLPGTAGAIGANREDAVIGLDGRRAAERALLRRPCPARALLAPLDDRRDHLRDDVAGAHHDHLVALADVLALEVLLVVQGRGADGDARDVDRLEHRERKQVARAPDVPDDLVQPGRGGRRGELPRDGPARLAPGDTQFALQAAVVDLGDDAVDLEVEGLAPVLPPAAALGHLIDPVQDRDVVIDLEAALAQPLERLGMAGGLPAPQRRDPVAPDRERPGGGDRGVELP
jgi:hypothetical protein